MKREDLDRKKLEPCMAELYANAEGPTPEVWPQNYDTWRDHPVWIYDFQGVPKVNAPMNCYYIPEEKMSNIVNKWNRGLHGYWYYRPKLNPGEPEYEERSKELQTFRTFEEQVTKDPGLTSDQKKRKIKKEALAHNFVWRIPDKEYMNYNIYLGASPSSNQASASKLYGLYDSISHLYHEGGFENTYMDYTHKEEFVWHAEDGKDYLVKRDTDDSTQYIIQDMAGNKVNTMTMRGADGFLRKLSADSFEVTYNNMVVALRPWLKVHDRPQYFNLLVDHKDWVRECLGLFISHLEYMASR